tara:strand:+ start:486 stop:908 length:423 start_codon:yes stop_codon:yes gene_type:complete
MSQISLKSISGITSITTPAGVDNQFTVHTNDSTEKFKITSGGVNVTGVITATQFKGDGSQLTGVVQSDTPLGNSTSSTVFYETDNETTISEDTTLSRASGNSGVIYTKFQQVVVAPSKSLIVDAGETFVVDAYGLRTPDF